jgi:PAS domain-containing protein
MQSGPLSRVSATAGADVRSTALDLLGVGIASSDGTGRLLDADPRFLDLHGIAGGIGGLEWPAAIVQAGSRLAPSDATAVAAGWSALLDARPDGGHGRRVVRLAGDRILEIGRACVAADRTVLIARDGSPDVRLSGSLLHDVNNAVGSMLAHLYLAMSDVDADHPARPWLEAVNRSTLDLREHVRRSDAGGTAENRGVGARG